MAGRRAVAVSKKRTRQAERGRGSSKARVLGGEFRIEAGGIFLLAAALISLFALYVGATASGAVGRIGSAIAYVIVWSFGAAGYVVPVLLGLSGLIMLWRKDSYMCSARFTAVTALSMCVVVFTEVLRPDLGFGPPAVGGGRVGSFLAVRLNMLFGPVGTVVILAAVSSMCLVVISDIPVRVAARFAARAILVITRVLAKAGLGLIYAVRSGFASVVMGVFEEKGDGSGAPEPELVRVAEPVIQPAFREASPAIPTPMPERKKPKPVAVDSPQEDLSQAEQLRLIEDRLLRELPPISLLRYSTKKKIKREPADPSDLVRVLEETMASFGVVAKVLNVSQGPMVTRFEVQPGLGVKVSKIVNLADDLALAFASSGVRIEAPIPGKAAVGIEVPNKEKTMVFLREVLESEEFQSSQAALTFALGKDIAGNPVVADLADILHLLVAGATGSGKSVCLNAIIASLLFKSTPEEVRLLMIDPKRVELSVYDGIPHLLAPVVTDPKKASGYLKWVVQEMENRYKLFQIAGARNIGQYNDMVRRGVLEQFLPENETKLPCPLPFIVVILDELADLMMVAQGEVEDAICRLAFMARAAGIHLIIATQRPSVDIITGIIKANIPSRIAFAVSSQVDSRIILDTAGAERLLGKGDMLFHPIGLPKPIRIQGAYISDDEVIDLVSFLKRQGEPEYQAKSVETSSNSDEAIAADDELFADAARLVLETGEASISKVQRRFRVGYARAARLIDSMELMGIIGPHEGSKPRKILVSVQELEEILGSKSGLGS